MYTIVETTTFQKDVDGIWSEEERGAFCAWIATNPDSGTVIPNSEFRIPNSEFRNPVGAVKSVGALLGLGSVEVSE